MSNALALITEKLTGKEMSKQLTVALDISPDDEAGQREAFKYAQSVISEIAKTQGAEYGDLTKCTPDSICRAVIDAAQFKVQIDGRKFAHLESRYDKAVKGQVATLQIDTNGFIAKIKEAHPDAEFKIQVVYKGDTSSIKAENGLQSFTYKSNNPFGKLEDLEGIIVQISYTNGGRMTSTVETISRADLNTIASKGKGLAWKDFTIERMKTAALKRAAKWHFRQNALLQKIIDYDNKNFELSHQPASETRPTIIDNINESVKPKVETEPEPDEDEIIDVEVIKDEPEVDLKKKGKAAAKKGVDAYKKWLGGLDKDTEKPLIKEFHKEWSAVAKDVDKEDDEEVSDI